MRALLRALRRVLRWLGTPIINRIDAHFADLMRSVMHREQERSVTSLAHLKVLRDELIHHIGTLGERLDNVQHADRFETQLIMDGAVRELIRLQHQVECLTEALESSSGRAAAAEGPRDRERQPLVIGARDARVA